MINDHGQRVASDNLDQLTEYAWTVRQALTAQGITGKDGQEIDHIELLQVTPKQTVKFRALSRQGL